MDRSVRGIVLAVALIATVALVVAVSGLRRPAEDRTQALTSPPASTSSSSAGSTSSSTSSSGANGEPLSIARGPLDLQETKTVHLVDGVTLHYIEQGHGGPNQIRVLEVDPRTKVTLDLVGAGTRYPALATTSRMGQRAHAIAAVNGEFFAPPGRPEFLFQSDSTLWQTALHASNMFAISEDEKDIYVDRIDPAIVASSGTRQIRVSDWNTVGPKGGKVVGFTPIGGSLAYPQAQACYALLTNPSAPSWTGDGKGITATFHAKTVGCRDAAPRFDGDGSVVLVANHASSLRSIRAGSSVRMSFSFGLRDVLDVAGGQPVLVKDGRRDLARCKTSFCDPQPRTGVGYTDDGRVLIATVDGRQPGWSTGMDLRDWADVFIQMGAVGALNLDGGGSTTMWVGDHGVVDRPANPGHRQRPVGTALVVLPGKDEGVPPSLAAGSG